MKKLYIHPAIEILFAEVEEMMALSIQNGNAIKDVALTKSNNWDIWNDKADTNQ